ncbi:MAG: aminoacyl-tRNA deacylase [Candidatus Nanopelagicales bacterium]
MAKKRSVDTPATRILKEANCAFVIHNYESDDEATSFGAEAADGIGVSRDRVYSTVLARADKKTIVAILPVSAELDYEVLAAAVGASGATAADEARVAKITGYELDAVSPLGFKKKRATVIDTSALDFKTIFISAGRHGFEVEVSPTDLIDLLHARTAPIARFYS